MSDQSMINNLRNMFENKYGEKYRGSDDDIRRHIKIVGVLSTGQETDEAILKEMELDM